MKFGEIKSTMARLFRPGADAACYGSSADLNIGQGSEGERRDFLRYRATFIISKIFTGISLCSV